MRPTLIFSRTLLGIVFIFSGFVKGIDPFGLAYKISDYLLAFNVEFLSVLALPLSFLLSFLEFAIGTALLSGVMKKLSSWLALIFIFFFTLLTLYIAVKNPVTDCGCFGDALILTNWQTFYKNLLILIPAVIVFTGKKSSVIRKTVFSKIQYSIFYLVVTGYIFTVFWSFNHLPVIDFRPYKTGVNIKEGMTVPERFSRHELVWTLLPLVIWIWATGKRTTRPNREEY